MKQQDQKELEVIEKVLIVAAGQVGDKMPNLEEEFVAAIAKDAEKNGIKSLNYDFWVGFLTGISNFTEIGAVAERKENVAGGLSMSAFVIAAARKQIIKRRYMN